MPRKFKKKRPVFIFYICFLQTNISLTSKNERTGKHYSFHFLCRWFFCCHYWNAVWICLSVLKASTCSFGRRVKRIEISKARPVTAAFVPFHKIGFRNIQVNVLTASFRNFRAKIAAFFLIYNIHSQFVHASLLLVATPTLLNCCTWVAAKAKRPERRGTRPNWNGCIRRLNKDSYKNGRFMLVFNIPEENWKNKAPLKANRPFARWRHFTTATGILFVFPFTFKFGNPSEV